MFQHNLRRFFRCSQPTVRARAVEALEDRRLLSVTLASQTTGGIPADAPGAGAVGSVVMTPDVSDDGRFVVFVSEANNLVAGDTNGSADVFVRDRTTNETRLVSAASDNSGPGNASSGDPGAGNARAGYAISGNGRYVVFASNATNLVAGQTDSNNLTDYFIRDLQSNTTALVTATPSGGYSTSSTIGGTNGRPAISDDGRFVAFTATYGDLDANVTDADDNAADVFVRDTFSSVTRQLSKRFDGQPGVGSVGATPSISADGRYVAFTGNDRLVADAPAFPFEQVWVYDTTADTLVNASVASDNASFAGGDSYLPQISADGRSVAFLSSATDLVAGFIDNNGDGGIDMADLFLRDLDANTTTLVSHDAGSAVSGAMDRVGVPSVSADGRFVAYVSRAMNLVAGITDANDAGGTAGGEDAFFFDATTGQNSLLSLNVSGTATGSGVSVDPDTAPERGPAMSDDGRYVVFASDADDLVAGDTNAMTELFVRDTQANTTRRLFDGLTLPAGAAATSPAISGDGTAIVFVASGLGIVTDAAAVGRQIFVDAQGGSGGGGGGDNETPGSLAPTLFTELPVSAVAGARVKRAGATVTVTNVAPDRHVGPVTITLYASLDATLDTAVDPEVATITRKLRIDSAQAKVVRLRIRSIPSVADGNYVIIARLSSDTAGVGVTTSDESVAIAGPFVDVSGTFATVPTTLTAGKRGRATVTVTNSGNVKARARVPVAVTISGDASGAGAVPVATVNAKLNLKPGASRTVRLNFKTPADVPAGTFFLGATLDSANVLAEKDEGNNSLISDTALMIV